MLVDSRFLLCDWLFWCLCKGGCEAGSWSSTEGSGGRAEKKKSGNFDGGEVRTSDFIGHVLTHNPLD